jgi:hypothetical protein
MESQPRESRDRFGMTDLPGEYTAVRGIMGAEYEPISQAAKVKYKKVNQD